MVYHAHVRNGVILLDDPVTLPEGASVSVQVLEPEETESDVPSPSLLDRLKAVVGTADGLPPDAASNVDHYLYGQPKV